MIDCLLGQAEVASRAPPNLGNDEARRRSRVDRDQVQLGAPNVNVAAKDGPPGRSQMEGDQLPLDLFEEGAAALAESADLDDDRALIGLTGSLDLDAAEAALLAT